jgi:hypothetical protein
MHIAVSQGFGDHGNNQASPCLAQKARELQCRSQAMPKRLGLASGDGS